MKNTHVVSSVGEFRDTEIVYKKKTNKKQR